MPAPPTRPLLVCYSTRNRSQVDQLVAVLRDHGVPLWRDQDDLRGGPSDGVIGALLHGPELGGALAWWTPDLLSSSFVQQHELPALRRRAGEADFVVFPIAPPGGDPKRVAVEFAGHDARLEWVRALGGGRDETPPADTHESQAWFDRVAEEVLDDRLQRARGHRVRLVLDARLRSQASEATLHLDWTRRFHDPLSGTTRTASSESWERLIRALQRVAHCAVKRLPADTLIEASGLPTLAGAMALGAALNTRRGLPVTWLQRMAGRPPQPWSLDVAPTDSGFRIETEHGQGEAVAVLVSINHEVWDHFRMICDRPDTPRFGFMALVCSDRLLQESMVDEADHLLQAGTARHVASRVVEAIALARRQAKPSQPVHLFFAGPAGVAMMVGQQLHPSGDVIPWDHGAGGVYQPTISLRPFFD